MEVVQLLVEDAHTAEIRTELREHSTSWDFLGNIWTIWKILKEIESDTKCSSSVDYSRYEKNLLCIDRCNTIGTYLACQ